MFEKKLEHKVCRVEPAEHELELIARVDEARQKLTEWSALGDRNSESESESAI